jgi:hypothetical protein
LILRKIPSIIMLYEFDVKSGMEFGRFFPSTRFEVWPFVAHKKLCEARQTEAGRGFAPENCTLTQQEVYPKFAPS